MSVLRHVLPALLILAPILMTSSEVAKRIVRDCSEVTNRKCIQRCRDRQGCKMICERSSNYDTCQQGCTGNRKIVVVVVVVVVVIVVVDVVVVVVVVAVVVVVVVVVVAVIVVVVAAAVAVVVVVVVLVLVVSSQ